MDSSLEIYKPYGINFATSFLFLIPIIYNYYCEIPLITEGSISCLMSSLLNHATYHPMINFLDKIVIKWNIVFNFIYFFQNNIYYYLATSSILYMLIIYHIIGLSHCNKNGIYWHSSLHLIGNLGICCLIKANIINY